MAKRPVRDNGRAGNRPSGPALHDSTIALSDSVIAQLQVPSGPPRPPPGRRTAPVPNEASLWPGQVVIADDFAAIPAPRRVGRWILAGTLAAAALAGGAVYARAWWGTSAPAATPAQEAPAVVTPAPMVAPPATAMGQTPPAAATTTRPAVQSSSKSSTVTRTSVKRSKSISTSKQTTSKRAKRVTSRKRTTRAR